MENMYLIFSDETLELTSKGRVTMLFPVTRLAAYLS
jgi:hypothetical protein